MYTIESLWRHHSESLLRINLTSLHRDHDPDVAVWAKKSPTGLEERSPHADMQAAMHVQSHMAGGAALLPTFLHHTAL